MQANANTAGIYPSQNMCRTYSSRSNTAYSYMRNLQ